jgi:hypothetical protein
MSGFYREVVCFGIGVEVFKTVAVTEFFLYVSYGSLLLLMIILFPTNICIFLRQSTSQ